MRIEQANAKINVYLNIVGRRQNGYHDIASIMQTVSLSDTVTVDFTLAPNTEISLSAEGSGTMPTDARNLAWRAAEAFLQATHQTGKVDIHIVKRIPMAAGLAGGSADAAAVLRALNTLCPNSLSLDDLLSLGATLGADVPFCICGGSAYVTGIGDCMEKFPMMPKSYLVVACHGEGVSTPLAYGQLDQKYHFFSNFTAYDDYREKSIALQWKNGDLISSSKSFFNLFEEVVPTIQGSVEELKKIMRNQGAYFAMMSGSGPSVFGIFSSEVLAQKACEILKSMGATAYVCQPCEGYFDNK